jgi:hypothetical protein
MHNPRDGRGQRRAAQVGVSLLALLLVVSACVPTVPAPPPGPTPTDVPPPTIVPLPTPAPTPTTVPTPVAPPRPTPEPGLHNKRGVHLLLDDGGTYYSPLVWDEHVAWAARLLGPGGHVVQLVRSNDLRPDVWQRYFDLVARERLVPIVRLATYKASHNQWWVAPTPDLGGRTYHSEADRFRRFFDAIDWRIDEIIVTVGNEPNRPDEWSGAPDPAAYARYLRDVTEALRRVSAVKIVILNAGLDGYAPSASFPGGDSMDSERFMEGMAAEVPGIFDLLDGWASHAYPLGPFNQHPAQQEFRVDDVRPDAPERAMPPDSIPNRGVNSYRWELWKLSQLGVRKSLPVYVTESGWRHERSQAPQSLDAQHASVEDEQFSQFVSLAFDGPPDSAAVGWTPWNEDPRVVTVALFALGGKPENWGHTNLLLVDAFGRVLGSYPFAERLIEIGLGRRD